MLFRHYTISSEATFQKQLTPKHHLRIISTTAKREMYSFLIWCELFLLTTDLILCCHYGNNRELTLQKRDNLQGLVLWM